MIKVRILRAVWCAGVSHAVGSIVEVSEADAIALVEGRFSAELVDPRDGPALKAYALDALKKIMHRVGPLAPPSGSPWTMVWPR